MFSTQERMHVDWLRYLTEDRRRAVLEHARRLAGQQHREVLAELKKRWR